VREELVAIFDPRFAHGSLRNHEEISLLKKVEWITPDIRAGMHRELNRQEAEYHQTVQPVHDAADAAFEKRWDAMRGLTGKRCPASLLHIKGGGQRRVLARSGRSADLP
jgi:hypothetical protein